MRAEHLQQSVKYLPKNILVFSFTASGLGSLVPVDGMMNSSKSLKSLKVEFYHSCRPLQMVKGHINTTLRHATTQ
jgi:hypothetical protein